MSYFNYSRIKNVLNYRKPAFWVITVWIIASIAVGIGVLSNPNQGVPLLGSSIYDGDLQSDKIVSVTLNGPREENQAATTTIAIKDGNFGWRQIGEDIETIEINFNSNFTEVRINDVLIKPSYSYKVINPAAV